MSWKKGLLFSLPLMAFVVLVLLFGRAIGTDPSVLPSTRIDKPLPVFELPALEDASRTVTVADLKGPLLLNVWATWCPSCAQEHPVLLQLAEQGVRIVGLNYKDDPAAARDYLARNGNPFALNIADVKGDFGLDLGVYGAPETYLVDAQGLIRYRHVGVVSPDAWRRVLSPRWQNLSAEPAAEVSP